MPLLSFYTTPGQLTPEEKQELATVLTSRYARSMPAFFVNIIFHEIPEDSFFIGGELTKGKFVRLTLEHIAINFKDFGVERGDAMSKKFLAFVGEVLKERFEPKGWRWEFNILETDRKLWRVQSIEPPPLNSDAMKVWDREQKGVEWRENFDAAFD